VHLIHLLWRRHGIEIWEQGAQRRARSLFTIEHLFQETIFHGGIEAGEACKGSAASMDLGNQTIILRTQFLVAVAVGVMHMAS
jgi:hypothetical protein